ncbi:MAG: hypothetical protein IT326_04765, partial [Anaerolineae bacterium]|nr:hypothetical protein [Anaerolineae bacterium]
HLRYTAIPLLSGTEEYARQRIFPGGTANNRSAFGGGVAFEESLSDIERMTLFDAQTSGGLLIAVPEAGFEAFNAHMAQAGAAWWEVGAVEKRGAALIRVTHE